MAGCVVGYESAIAIGIVAGIPGCGTVAGIVDSLSESVQQESPRQTKVA